MELSGHNQEVNCLDSKDGLIISGSRDQTARVSTCVQFIIVMQSAMVFTILFFFFFARKLKRIDLIAVTHLQLFRSIVYILYIYYKWYVMETFL